MPEAAYPAESLGDPMAQKPVRVGRESACDIVIDDPTVSRRHAEIRLGVGGETAVIRDLTGGETLHLVDGRWEPVSETTPVDLHTPLLLGTWQTTPAELIDQLPVPPPSPEPEPEPEPETAPPPVPEPVPQPKPAQVPAPAPDPAMTPPPAKITEAMTDTDVPRPMMKGGGAAPIHMPNPEHALLGNDPHLIVRYDANKKTGLIAYLLWFFLGVWGAHRFYMGRIGTGVAMLLLTLAGIISAFVVVGIFIIIGVYIWMIVDAFLIPGWIRKANNDLIDQLSGGAPAA